jgi:uncharacterized BrkB/YihY/UPF0761 family membrane protein
MEQALTSFFSIQTLVFCIVVYFAVQGFRTISEAIAKKVSMQRFEHLNQHISDAWTNVILPSAPIVIGGLIAAFILSYPYPPPFDKGLYSRVFYGIVCGGACSEVYRFFRFYVKKFLPDNMKKKIDELTPNPGPGSDPPLPPDVNSDKNEMI